jgi:hypothetical protein
MVCYVASVAITEHTAAGSRARRGPKLDLPLRLALAVSAPPALPSRIMIVLGLARKPTPGPPRRFQRCAARTLHPMR